MDNTNKAELQLIYDIASAVIQCAADETTTGCSIVGYRDITRYIDVCYESYVRLFDAVFDEIITRDEVIELDECNLYNEREYDINLYTIYCPNIDDYDYCKVDADKILPVTWRKA